MKATVWFVLLFMSLVALTGPVAFADCKHIGNQTSDNYAVRAPSRLFQGIVNAGLGWTKLICEPFKSVKHEGQDIVDGIFDGFGQATYYTVLGAWDILTFWVPGEGGKELATEKCVLTGCCPKS